MKIQPHEMPLMQQLVKSLCGVSLHESKTYLIEGRLGGIAEQAGCASFCELHARLQRGDDPNLRDQVVDAITTHETTWFRDGAPFEVLQQKLLKDVVAARREQRPGKRLRIWSAACSSGQEPYSISMVLHECLPDLTAWDVEILATDISVGTLAHASEGVFSALDMSRSSRPNRMKKYFTQVAGGCRIVDSVRKLVKFRSRNLLEPFAGIGPFDIIFLRNVLIYFDAPTRRSIVERAVGLLEPHGYLLTGSQENLGDLGPKLRADFVGGVVVYQPQSAEVT